MKRTLPFTCDPGRDSSFDPSSNQNLRRLYKPTVFAISSGSDCPVIPRQSAMPSVSVVASKRKAEKEQEEGALVLGKFLTRDNVTDTNGNLGETTAGPVVRASKLAQVDESRLVTEVVPGPLPRHHIPMPVNFSRSLSPRFSSDLDAAHHLEDEKKLLNVLCQRNSKYVVSLLTKPRDQQSSELLAEAYCDDDRLRAKIKSEHERLKREVDMGQPHFEVTSRVVSPGAAVMRPSFRETLEEQRAEAKKKASSSSSSHQDRKVKALKDEGRPTQHVAPASGYDNDVEPSDVPSRKAKKKKVTVFDHPANRKRTLRSSCDRGGPERMTSVPFARSDSLRIFEEQQEEVRGAQASSQTPQPRRCSFLSRRGEHHGGSPVDAATTPELTSRDSPLRAVKMLFHSGAQLKTTGSPSSQEQHHGNPKNAAAQKKQEVCASLTSTQKFAAAALTTPEEQERIRQTKARDIPAHGFHSDVARKPMPGMHQRPLYDSGVMLSPEKADRLVFCSSPAPALLKGLRFPSENVPMMREDDPLRQQAKAIREASRAARLRRLNGEDSDSSASSPARKQQSLRQRIASIADGGGPLPSRLQAHPDFTATAVGDAKKDASEERQQRRKKGSPNIQKSPYSVLGGGRINVDLRMIFNGKRFKEILKEYDEEISIQLNQKTNEIDNKRLEASPSSPARKAATNGAETERKLSSFFQALEAEEQRRDISSTAALSPTRDDFDNSWDGRLPLVTKNSRCSVSMGLGVGRTTLAREQPPAGAGEAAVEQSTFVHDAAVMRLQAPTPALSSALSVARVAEIYSRLEEQERKRRASELANNAGPRSIFDAPLWDDKEGGDGRVDDDLLGAQESFVVSSDPPYVEDGASPSAAQHRPKGKKLIHFL
jgi:hypothetical protein